MKSMIPFLCWFPLLLVPWEANASLADPGEEQAYITVRELMRLEGEQALAAARQRRGQGQAAVSPVVGKPGLPAESTDSAPRLVGIYGVGPRLFAEVRHGSQAWLFLKGQSRPVGRTNGDDLYRLRELAGNCVRLEHGGDETVLCLSRGGRQ